MNDIYFRHPQSKQSLCVATPVSWLWVLLFGPLWFVAKGVWTWAIVSLFVAVITAGISWFVFPFFTYKIIRSHYVHKGWEEEGQNVPAAAEPSRVRQLEAAAKEARERAAKEGEGSAAAKAHEQLEVELEKERLLEKQEEKQERARRRWEQDRENRERDDRTRNYAIIGSIFFLLIVLGALFGE